MRDYLARLPDYTCRVTLERSTRRNSHARFTPSDRIRLEVAYTGGQELYSWPGDDRFEGGIEDLLSGHGMVSNGSYALHMRNLFVRAVATFAAPRMERCEARPCLRVDFDIPASLSGYSVSAGGGSAPAPLTGTAWFDPDSLDIVRLEVRVENIPSSVRIAATRETTLYTHAAIGDTDFVLPASSELFLRDRDGSEARNRSTFDRYRRYTGTSTVFYEPAAPDAPQQSSRAPKPAPPPLVRDLTATLDSALTEDTAIGDQVPVTTRDGTHLTARVTAMRNLRNHWIVDLSLRGVIRPGLPLPLPQGHTVTFRRE
jgi:hypothetical protein